MKNSIKTCIVFVFLIFLASCSIKKNTWTSRATQATTTRFNVYFNGMVSYKEGIGNIRSANVEDYSSFIPMYTISRHTNAAAGTSSMDRTIEKCRKAIKLHSIKVKPQKNYRKTNSPEYKLFYAQQEFNPALKEVWLLLAKAEFHKADFVGAAATFAYVSRLYLTDKEMVAICQLWMARSYGELNWFYEAEQVLSKLDQNSLSQDVTGLYASVNADLLVKKKLYKEAIPFLKLALKSENDKFDKQRFRYLLAQLYTVNGEYKAAYDVFTDVIKSNPAYEMDFNARISRAQIDQTNTVAVRKDLRKMLRNKNNADYLDQIYFALGNTYLNVKDTVNAVENYDLAIEKSTRNGIDKANTLIKLGDLHYSNNEYIAAQPCYESAGKLISSDNGNYSRVTKRAEMLGELVTQQEIVVLQDSLQRLSLLSEKERLVVVNGIIAKLKEDERLAAEKELKQSKEEFGDEYANMRPIGGNMPGAIGDWYFYNVGLMRSGESDFRKKWGKRKLEDNWRRANKAASLFADESPLTNSPTVAQNDTSKVANVEPDVKKPEFYLNQIPITSAQIEKSNSEIANAMFNEGLIYKDKIEDLPLALGAFERFVSRFPTDKRIAESYYNIYQIQLKLGKNEEAEIARGFLISNFPKSQYAIVLSQPDYLKRMESMYNEQDSIYNDTYKAFNESKYDKVVENVSNFKKNFPLSTLVPKFMFLNALSVGKSATASAFELALTELITAYPASDVSSMSKDILALVKQGQTAKQGTTSGTLLAKREIITNEEINAVNPKGFFNDKKSKHRLLLISNTNTANSNRLLYNIASFNFSRFMIKDFELVVNKLDTLNSALSVTNFESYDEVEWYTKSLATDITITQMFADLQIRPVIISEPNFALIRTGSSLDDYLQFANLPVAITTKNVANSSKFASKKEDKVEIQPMVVTAESTKQTTSIDSKPKVEVKPVVGEKTIATPTQVANEKTTQPPVQIVDAPVVKVQPKVEEPPVPLFKGLFGYRANEAHYVAVYVMSGVVDFDKTKTAFDVYNAKNYGVMNLKVSMEVVGSQKIIIIGSLADANIAKSYLLRMVKEASLFEGLKGANYRNLLGSQKNLNVLMQQNALNVYFEFMKEYYLK